MVAGSSARVPFSACKIVARIEKQDRFSSLCRGTSFLINDCFHPCHTSVTSPSIHSTLFISSATKFATDRPCSASHSPHSPKYSSASSTREWKSLKCKIVNRVCPFLVDAFLETARRYKEQATESDDSHRCLLQHLQKHHRCLFRGLHHRRVYVSLVLLIDGEHPCTFRTCIHMSRPSISLHIYQALSTAVTESVYPT